MDNKETSGIKIFAGPNKEVVFKATEGDRVIEVSVPSRLARQLAIITLLAADKAEGWDWTRLLGQDSVFAKPD